MTFGSVYNALSSAGGSSSCTSRPAPAMVGGDADNASINAGLKDEGEGEGEGEG